MILKDKVCVVTGAAQGIGRRIAEKMLAEGAIVYGCDRAEGSMQALADANPAFHPLYFDVTDQQGAKTAMMQVKKEQGRIDVLVNNAGVVFNKKIGMILREETELMFRVNVIAVIELIQLVSRIMARTGGGSISPRLRPFSVRRVSRLIRPRRVRLSPSPSRRPRNWPRRVYA